MMKKILIAAATGAAVLGIGVAAVAETSSSPTSGTGTATAPATPSGAKGAGKGPAALRRIEHGTFVTRGRYGDRTHDVIHGSVTSVSPTSVSVRAADGFGLTYTVNATTKVVKRAGGTGSATQGTIADVKRGDDVIVTGIESGSVVTAAHVVDLGTK